MFPSEPLLNVAELAKLFAERLGEHLPGTDTGDPEITDKRTCWNKACHRPWTPWQGRWIVR